MLRLRRSRASAACALLCSSWVACGLAGDGALTLREALELASARNSLLRAQDAEAKATQERARAQALGPPLLLDLEVENFAGSGDLSGLRAAETTLQLSRIVELGDKARLRRDAGNETVAKLRATQRARQVDLLAEVARRFMHVLADQARLEAARRGTQLAQNARDAVQARITAGATSQTFGHRAEIALARARIDEEHAEHELSSSTVGLATMWGEASPSFVTVRADLFALPALENVATYLARLDANPELLAFASEQRALDAQSRLAQAQRTPDVTINVGVRRLESFDDQAFVAGISVPFGSARRNAPEIAALRSQREQLDFELEARHLELRAIVFALYQEAVHARAEAVALREQIRPQAEQLVQTTEAGYRSGRFSLVELTDAQQELLNIEQDAIRAAEAFHVNLIEIERLTGEALHAL